MTLAYCLRIVHRLATKKEAGGVLATSLGGEEGEASQGWIAEERINPYCA
jgi:hypothetical protein